MNAVSVNSCKTGLFGFCLVIAFLVPLTSKAQTIDSIKGPMCVVFDSVSGKTFTLSPEQSTYNVVITDGLAHVKIVQLFVNKFGRIKDIAYVFPLPHKGSVHSMSMLYKNMVYEAKIMEKQEAQRKYDSVVTTGGSGALLLQDRPNIFQQHLANIAFGDSACITIGFSMPLKYNNGAYELAIPTMIGERYQSSGVDFVPSGPFWNPPEKRDGQSIQINALIQTGFEITSLESPTHPLTTGALSEMRPILEGRGVVEPSSELKQRYCNGAVLLSQTTYPNRDFVLRFSRKEALRDFSIASYFDSTKKEGYFALNIFPDTSLFNGTRPNLDIVLLVDHSGSQSGWPLETEKKICANILSRLLPTDKLNVLAFETSLAWAYGNSAPKNATPENISTANSFVNSLTARGGTELLNGIQAALAAPQDSGFERYYVFLTDGFVTNEAAIITAIKDHPSHPTVFTFGCGNSINRYLIDQAAAMGGGYGTVITQLEAAESVAPFVDAAWEKIITPQLKNITVDFGGCVVSNVLMPSGSNLFIGRPVEVYGTYASGGPSTVTVKGVCADKETVIQKSIDLAVGQNMNFMVPKVWAREFIEYLSVNEGTTQTNKSAIIELSTGYQVLSKYTAFLAISPQKQNTVPLALRPAENRFKSSADRMTLTIVNRILKIVFPRDVGFDKLVIYDVRGRALYTMAFKSGTVLRIFSWDGRLRTGGRLNPGKYIICLHTSAGVLRNSFVWK